MSVGTITPPGLTVGDFITVKPKYQKQTKGRTVNKPTYLGDLSNLEVNTVHGMSDPNELTITISEEFVLRGRSERPKAAGKECATSGRMVGPCPTAVRTTLTC